MENEERVIEFCRKFLHLYLEQKDFQSVKESLAGQSSWIGTGEDEISTNYAQAGNRLDLAGKTWQGWFRIKNEWYQCIPVSEGSFTVYGELDLAEEGDYPITMQMHVRFTLVCCWNGMIYRLLHAHFSTPNSEQENGEFVPKRMVQDYNRQLEKALAQRTEQLRQKNAALATLSENVPGGIFYIQADGIAKVTYCNSGYLDMIGCTREQFVQEYGEKVESFFHPADRERLNQSILGQLEKGGVFREECRIRRRDGSVRWVSFQGKHIVDEFSRNVLCCVLIDQTITKKAEEKARIQSSNFRTLVENIPGGVKNCLNDEYFTICYVSDGFLSLFGYTREEVKTLFHDEYINMIYPEDREKVRGMLKEQLAAGNMIELVYRGLCKNGDIVWILNKGRLIDEGGRGHFHCVLVDITESRAAQEALRISEERYRIVCEQSNDVIYEYNIPAKSIVYTANFKRMFGRPEVGENFPFGAVDAGSVHPDDQGTFLELFKRVRSGEKYAEAEVRIQKHDKSYLWCRIQASTILDIHGRPIKAVGKYINIDEQRREREHLIARAERDALTGLYNKETSRVLIEKRLSRSSDLSRHALFIVDIDDFKGVNDNLGHLFGDAVLSEIAEKIKSIFRSSDIIGRIGGDEFIVFLCDVTDKRSIESKAQILKTVFRTTYSGNNHDYKISGSIGVAQYPQDAASYTELFQKADYALYYAKSHGKDNYAFYSKEVESDYLLSGERERTAEKELPVEEQRPINENIVEYIFKIFYETEDISAAINLILGLVGRSFHASRVYVFENNEDDRTASNTFEWCSRGTASRRDGFQNVPNYYIENYHKLFDENGVFYCQDTSALQDSVRDELFLGDVQSLLQVAIMDQGKFKGCVGFDGCGQKLYPTQQAIDSLNVISQIISTFLLKKHAQDKLDKAYRITRLVLDQIDMWTYVIDPSTYELLFVNKKAEEIAPGVQKGNYCYRGLCNQEKPCGECPLVRLNRSTQPVVQKMYNQYLGIWMKITANKMTWVDGKEVCLLSCSDISSLE